MRILLHRQFNLKRKLRQRINDWKHAGVSLTLEERWLTPYHLHSCYFCIHNLHIFDLHSPCFDCLLLPFCGRYNLACRILGRPSCSLWHIIVNFFSYPTYHILLKCSKYTAWIRPPPLLSHNYISTYFWGISIGRCLLGTHSIFTISHMTIQIIQKSSQKYKSQSNSQFPFLVQRSNTVRRKFSRTLSF
jgi:hypothetical protein